MGRRIAAYRKPYEVRSIWKRGALSVEGRSQFCSVALALSTCAGTMSDECRLDECAESICPSKICAQLQRTRTFVAETRACGVGANAGGSTSGISSAGPM